MISFKCGKMRPEGGTQVPQGLGIRKWTGPLGNSNFHFITHSRWGHSVPSGAAGTWNLCRSDGTKHLSTDRKVRTPGFGTMPLGERNLGTREENNTQEQDHQSGTCGTHREVCEIQGTWGQQGECGRAPEATGHCPHFRHRHRRSPSASRPLARPHGPY